MRRLARAYGVTDYVFCKYALGCERGVPSPLNDLPDEVLKRLESGTGVSVRAMRDMTPERVIVRAVIELDRLIKEDEGVLEPSEQISGQVPFVDGI